MAISTTNLRLVANAHRTKIIIGVSFVVIIVFAGALAYVIHNRQHSRKTETLTLNLTSLTALNSSTWSFSIRFSDPGLVHNSLAISPMFSYYNSTTTRSLLTNAVIGSPILFHPDGHQASFSGFLPLDKVLFNVSPFLLAQQAGGTVRAAVNVALYVGNRVRGWACFSILKTASSTPSSSSRCTSVDPV